MPINFKDLEAKLQSIARSIPVDEIDAAATKAATQLKGAVSTNAGSDLNATTPGVKSITVTADFAELEKIAESLEATMKPIAEQLEKDLAPIAEDIEKQINTAPTPGLLKADVPGVGSKITKTVGNTTNLTTLTGKPVKTTNFNKANVTATSPEGIRETLLGVGENIKFDEIKSAMESVLTDDVKQDLSSAGSSVFEVTKKGTDGIFESLKSGDLSSVFKKVENTTSDLNSSGALGNLVNIMDGIGGEMTAAIRQAVPGINTSTSREIFAKTTDLKIEEAVAIAKNANPAVDAGEVESKLKSIDATVAGQTTDPAPEPVALEEPVKVGENSSKWSNTPSSDLFTRISSIEELKSEIINNSNELTEVIIDWEKTDASNLTVSDINRVWQLTYDQPIDYHYVILESGKFFRGRPLDQPSTTLNLDTNHSARGIYVGIVLNRSKGYNANQSATLKAFMKGAYGAFPLMQIFGLRDITGSFGDGPGFEIEDKIYKWFERVNLYDPSVEAAKSPQELISLAGATNA